MLANDILLLIHGITHDCGTDIGQLTFLVGTMWSLIRSDISWI